MRRIILLGMAALLVLCSCNKKGYRNMGLDERPVIPEGQTARKSYANPVIKNNCPDPSIIDDRERTGYFYAYSTQNGANGAEDVVYLPVYRSKDMINWELMGNAFGGQSRPTWGAEVTRVWAPDINYINGQYVLYYALGHLEHSNLGTSGVAVSETPTGPFRDLGIIASQDKTGVANSIDPNYFEDEDGRKYLFWGSYGAGSGIHVVELSDDGLSLRPGAEPVHVAGNSNGSNMEGAYVYKHGGYYYLFASMGNSFAGGESTYRVVVGRSKNITGPYTGPSGKDLTAAWYPSTAPDVIMEGYEPNTTFVGPGHNGEIVTDDAGSDWMIMHVRWSGDKYGGRPMILERLYWGADWPYFGNSGRPTYQAYGPYFNQKEN